MDHTINECQDYAISLRNKGYNCGQCVLMAFSKHFGINEKYAARIASPYGTGFSGAGELCGALSVLAIAEGFISGGSEPQDKVKAMSATKILYDKFKAENDGKVLCRDLKSGEPVRTCPELIKQAIRIFFESHPELLEPRPLINQIIKDFNS